jgi:hypothetical protein
LERRGVLKEFWWGNLRERDHLEVSAVDGRIIRWIFMTWDVGGRMVGAWIGLIWLRIGTGGGLL